MTFYEIKKSSRHYYPVIAMDRLVSNSLRRFGLSVLGIILVLLILPATLYFAPKFVESSFLADYQVYFLIAAGAFFIILPFWLILFALHAFFNSYYFRGLETSLLEHRLPDELPISFEIAVFSYYADERDMTASLLYMSFGRTLFLRAGLPPEDINLFLSQRKQPLPSEAIDVVSSASSGRIKIPDIAIALYKADKELASFLFARKIQEKDFLEAARWFSAEVTRFKRRARWWGKDSLGRIQGLGKDWAYGGSYKLKHYASELTMAFLPSVDSKPLYIRNEVGRLETVLAKAREANAIIVGEDGGSKNEVLSGFVSAVQEGRIFPQLEHKKVFELDTNRLVSENGNKAAFEKTFIEILDESIKAGNVILVIPDIASFIKSSAEVGSSAASLLDPYLSSTEIQFIALASPAAYHELVEPISSIAEKFDVLMIKEGGVSETLESLEEEAEKTEARYGIVFSVPVLSSIADSAERYITHGVMPDKAIDLFYEVAAAMNKAGRKYATIEDVMEFVKNKTGIPTGEVTSSEKTKLVNLENILHQRVIGQDEAVSAIASSMKRARAGLTNPKRPMGSFLFLGPTGVGKTETTKALAEAFFGDESRILRFDMSEYNGPDALAKLIGSFDTKAPGILSSMLREKPYGVLLLDEFEKSNQKVMDLFLQILDEGFFSDMYGQKINARNLIIIATSNAGSDMIWDIIGRGENLADKKSGIIDSVVKAGVYRPELLNRFDGVVLFHPIMGDHLKEIAKLMLGRLKKRLAGKGYELIINDAVIDYLVKFGADPKFGARPMNRAIQDKIEQRIADKIIKGEMISGQKIEFNVEELENF